MIDSTRASESQIKSRDALGQRLQREFIAYHQRRKRLRKGGAAMATMLLLLCSSWVWWVRQADRANSSRVVARDPDQATQTAPPVARAQGIPALAPSKETTLSSTPAIASTEPEVPVARQGANYRSIDVQMMSDEELQESLQAFSSDWMVVSIDGQLRAFHESELKPAPRLPGG